MITPEVQKEPVINPLFICRYNCMSVSIESQKKHFCAFKICLCAVLSLVPFLSNAITLKSMHTMYVNKPTAAMAVIIIVCTFSTTCVIHLYYSENLSLI